MKAAVAERQKKKQQPAAPPRECRVGPIQEKPTERVNLGPAEKELVRKTVRELLADGKHEADLPRAFLDAARDPESPQHRLFPAKFWDDRYMADIAREGRIRDVINTVTISWTDERPSAVAIQVKVDEIMEDLAGTEAGARYTWRWKQSDQLTDDDLAAKSRLELKRVMSALDNVRQFKLEDRYPDWRKIRAIVEKWSAHPV